ncbi:MAG TPA: GNAT family N-acetyltransferase [Pseudorhizobium sp.]|nr:GNAT family N-acetyltransferase [Pseudorhizobium sp.]
MKIAEFHVRPAQRDDLADVRDLLVETWHDSYDALLGPETVTKITGEWHSIEALSRQLDLPDTAFLVAEAKGRILGHVFANARELPVLVIARLYVRPSWQRRGIGKSLLDAAAAIGPEIRRIRLDVEAENRKGMSFYRREGFRPAGEVLQAGIRHIRMEKHLD